MTGPIDEARRLYEEAETQAANAMEQLVSRDGFGQLLALMTENVVALTRISSDVFDLGLRNLRLAGRQDVTRLGRHIGRTEDKLEMVLQEVERIGQRLEERDEEAQDNGQRAPAAKRPARTARSAEEVTTQ